MGISRLTGQLLSHSVIVFVRRASCLTCGRSAIPCICPIWVLSDRAYSFSCAKTHFRVQDMPKISRWSGFLVFNSHRPSAQI
ncbi:uncharacterized protein BDW70DRAFT_26026 [Aspergillus foveolatus]|uniref:uncharacterized protein n=1 Tax=Aspergillus foveolatus TaxID=210207 RepID=UPI003CCDECDD